MKKIVLALLLAFPSAAFADEPVGGWVIVDASGKQVGGVIVCTPSVCGDPNSAVSKDLLKDGQRFVQQTLADPVTNNVAGIPASDNTKITVSATNVFTVERSNPVVVEKPSVTIKAVEKTTTQFTLQDTASGTIQAPIIKAEVVGTITPVVTPTEDKTDYLAQWLAEWLAQWNFLNFDFSIWSM